MAATEIEFMFGRSVLLAILAMGITNIAHAQSNCIAPFAPTVPDGATATQEDMDKVRGEVLAFLSDSDSYQSCILVYIRQMEEEARRKDEPVSQGDRAELVRLANANQRLKERTGEAFNVAVRTFNALHPEPGAGDQSASGAASDTSATTAQ
jgi:hypothetical protein